ncbi:hypothetical protein L596_011936 [Steinernema carpocapsae]|uniref:Nuclear receptor domain-containing protein n=1 Tax=Steinernema carpocapsae TaxID=34508 RepID=A0A4U5NVI4_STECR|nr:hypothetical protein L596_011936 [Steinernema carpocapsae]
MPSCAVCDSKAHGVHFQVNSCRACAAFFRRSIAVGKDYKCRRASRDCELKDAGSKNICRFCRYQKCLQAGMVYTVQIVSPIVTNDRRVPVVQPDSEYKSLSPADVSHITYKDNKLVYDSAPLIDKVKKVFNTIISYASSLTTMQSFLFTYKSFWPDGDNVEITEAKALDYRIFLQSCEQQILRAARFAMSCKEFSQLDLEDKWLILQPFWHHFHHLTNVTRSIAAFGRTSGHFAYLITDNICVKEGFRFTMPIDEKNKKSWRVSSKNQLATW